jgi:8-oxo-dGTP diphosphatase
MTIPAAGGIIFDDDGRLLLILRTTPPSALTWSVPGGKCESGESTAAACVREVAEETGLAVDVQRLAGRVVRAAPQGGVYVIDDFVCRVVSGELAAGDDAGDAGWFSRADLTRLSLAEGLFDALREWGLLPQ